MRNRRTKCEHCIGTQQARARHQRTNFELARRAPDSERQLFGGGESKAAKSRQRRIIESTDLDSFQTSAYRNEQREDVELVKASDEARVAVGGDREERAQAVGVARRGNLWLLSKLLFIEIYTKKHFNCT